MQTLHQITELRQQIHAARLAGKRINWRVGGTITAVGAVFALVMLMLQAADPRAWNQEGPDSGEQYFFPSLARTTTGGARPRGGPAPRRREAR